MRFYTFVLRNVLRRRVRSTLTMIGMAVAVGAVVALVGISDGFAKSFLQVYQGRGVGLIVSRSDSVSPMTSTLPQAIGDEIRKVDGVEAVCPGLVDFLSFENLGLNGIVIQGWPAGVYMFDELKILDGHTLTKDDTGKRSIMIGRDLAENAKLKLGDKVMMSDEEYRVAAIYDSMSGVENSMAVLLVEDAQKLMGKPGLITGCTIRVKDPTPEGIEKVRTAVEGAVAEKMHLKGKIRAKPPTEFVQSSTQIRVANAMAWMTSAVALFIGGIGMLNTMVMSVFERTREIGILRAIGWRPSRVLRMILMESVLLSIGGGIIGTIGGVALTWVLSRQPIVNGAIDGTVAPEVIVKGFVIALVVGLIGAAYPAYRGSRMLPTEALRHE